MQEVTIGDGEDRSWRNNLADLIETLERAWRLANAQDHEEGQGTIYELLLAARGRALWRLAQCGGLIGAEYCNECAEAKGTVTDVEGGDMGPLVVYCRPSGNQPPVGTQRLCDIDCDHFFRVPGSAALDALAIAELLRQPPKGEGN